MMGGDPEYDGIVIRKMSGTDVPSSFECSKPLFAEHLRVMAFYDQQERMGQPYLFVRGDEIVGMSYWLPRTWIRRIKRASASTRTGQFRPS